MVQKNVHRVDFSSSVQLDVLWKVVHQLVWTWTWTCCWRCRMASFLSAHTLLLWLSSHGWHEKKKGFPKGSNRMFLMEPLKDCPSENSTILSFKMDIWFTTIAVIIWILQLNWFSTVRLADHRWWRAKDVFLSVTEKSWVCGYVVISLCQR